MNLSVLDEKSLPLRKKLFKLKPQKDNGFILSIHYSSCKKAIRFIYSTLHEVEYILAVADREGHIYIVDFLHGKYWGLPKLNSCSFIKFSALNPNEILVGKYEGAIDIVNIESGCSSGKLLGHNFAVNNVSFAEKYLCLSSSQSEAIVWDLRNNVKLQVLSLQKACALKFVTFIPVSNHILACFQDDVIQVWRNWTYENLKQFLPNNWNNYSVKCLTFSKNGKIMVVGGYLPNLAIFLLDSWKLYKLIVLPKEIQSVKYLEFVSTNFDGGSNKVVAVLSGKGIVYFYDIEENIIVSELRSSFEINKIEASYNGRYISCLSCSGEIEIFNLTNYTQSPKNVVQEKAEFLQKKKVKFRRRPNKAALQNTKCQISNILNIEKLKSTLKEYGQFPDSYRMKIWEKLLELPNNVRQYNSIINHVTLEAFKDLYKQFPLENKNLIKSVKKLLNNIVTWCPFFAHVEYLPIFAFPFVKIFQNKPVACFEAICTIIVNWCQHWFEYHPLHPMNILAIIENVLLEHDPDLLYHFSLNKIPADIYAWNFLESAFSEVLPANDWLQFWDHVLINEPSFLLCAVVSYNTLFRKTLFALKEQEEFILFFQKQNPVEVKRLINKTYYILENTSDKVHPKQYLDEFRPLEAEVYPNFVDYPKTVVEFENKQMRDFEEELTDLRRFEDEIVKEKGKDAKHLEDIEKQKEEDCRIIAMEKACMEKLKSYQEHIKLQRSKIQEMRNRLLDEEKLILESSKRKFEEHNLKKREGTLGILMNNIELTQSKDDHDVFKVENELSKRLLELLRHKMRVERIFQDDTKLKESIGTVFKGVREEKQKLRGEIEKIRGSGESSLELKKLNIATSIGVMEELIKKIEIELSRDSSCPNDYQANIKVWALQNETKELEKEVSKLLKLLSKSKKRSPISSTNSNRTSTNDFESGSCSSRAKYVRFTSSNST